MSNGPALGQPAKPNHRTPPSPTTTRQRDPSLTDHPGCYSRNHPQQPAEQQPNRHSTAPTNEPSPAHSPCPRSRRCPSPAESQLAPALSADPRPVESIGHPTSATTPAKLPQSANPAPADRDHPTTLAECALDYSAAGRLRTPADPLDARCKQVGAPCARITDHPVAPPRPDERAVAKAASCGRVPQHGPFRPQTPGRPQGALRHPVRAVHRHSMGFFRRSWADNSMTGRHKSALSRPSRRSCGREPATPPVASVGTGMRGSAGGQFQLRTGSGLTYPQPHGDSLP